jgi:hypothetical protein
VYVTPFFLVGVALLVFGARGVAKGLLDGAWELEVPDAGGVLGQPPPAILMPPRQVLLDGELRYQLRAYARTSRGGGSVGVETLWQMKWTLPASMVHPKMRIAIVLPLPGEGPSTMELDRGASYIGWQLTVSDAGDRRPYRRPGRSGSRRSTCRDRRLQSGSSGRDGKVQLTPWRPAKGRSSRGAC